MHNKRGLFLIISAVITISLSFTPSLGSSVNIANAQSSPCVNGEIISSHSSNILPVILIHGYFEPSSIWSVWEDLLSQNNIPFCTVSFHQSDDPCGSAKDHAGELAQIVQQVKSMTGQDKVNIVAHSKGGLDSRVYLDNTNTPDVANLIMIGTPNGGSPLADNTILANLWLKFSPPNSFFCTPALFDLATGAAATMANQNTHTNYWTIAGDWVPLLQFCSASLIDTPGSNYLRLVLGLNNDGVVPVGSVESQQYFHPLSHSSHCHQDLLGDGEYKVTEPILLRTQ